MKKTHLLLAAASLAAALFMTAGLTKAQDPQGGPPGGATAGAANGPMRGRGQMRASMMRGMTFGTVTSVGVDRLEIKKNDGSSQTVMVDDRTQYNEGQKQIGLEDLKPGDHVVVRAREAEPASGAARATPPASTEGSTTPSGEPITAATVRRLTDQQTQWFQGDHAFGQITAIDGNEITVNNPRQGEQTIEVSDSTTLTNQGSPINLRDLKVGDRIMAVGKTTDGKFVAARIMTGMRGRYRRGGAGGPGGPGDFGGPNP